MKLCIIHDKVCYADSLSYLLLVLLRWQEFATWSVAVFF